MKVLPEKKLKSTFGEKITSVLKGIKTWLSELKEITYETRKTLRIKKGKKPTKRRKKMNKKAQKGVLGFVLILIVLIFIFTSFALIDPFKEFLDTARNSTSLNCVGTDGFNQTDFDDDSELEKLTRRPTCFVTGMSMIYFIGAFILASFVWLIKNWGKLSK